VKEGEIQLIHIKPVQWKNLLGQENGGPCVSVYFPLSGSDKSEKEYSLCVEALKMDAERQLIELGHSIGFREIILSKMRPTFLNIQRPQKGEQRSLAFFSSFGFAAFALLSRQVQPLVVVSKSFHIKPLIPTIDESSQARLDQEYEKALSKKLVVHTLPEILRLNDEGRVRKLVVANDEMLFGDLEMFETYRKFQPTKSYARAGLDDILDDLAERIGGNVGEVFTASRRDLPEGRLAVAFLHPDERAPEGARAILSPTPMTKIQTHRIQGVRAA
jgi:hypothetical protein